MTPADGGWPPSPADIGLADDDVAVWRAALDLPAATRKRLQATLTPDEQVRAAHILGPKTRDHFIAARGILRAVLGRLLGEPPGRLRFDLNPYGKPELRGAPDGLRFNLSTSYGLALIAVTRGRAIGVDVERIRPNLPYEQMASLYFSPREAAALLALPEGLRREAFFACWTRKEATIKACGEGLSIPLEAFDVSLTPGQPTALLRAEGDDPARWALRALDAGEGYAAALAVEGHGWRLHCWQWPMG